MAKGKHFINKAIMLVSRFPFFSEFEILIKDLLEAGSWHNSKMQTVIEEYLAHVLFSIPEPPRGIVTINYELMVLTINGVKSISFSRPPKN